MGNETKQKQLVWLLVYLARLIEDGRYGSGDDLDTEALLEDVQECFEDDIPEVLNSEN